MLSFLRRQHISQMNTNTYAHFFEQKEASQERHIYIVYLDTPNTIHTFISQKTCLPAINFCPSIVYDNPRKM